MIAQMAPPPNERYYLLLFGSHDTLHRPKYTHTWATLVRVQASDVGQCGMRTPGCVDPALEHPIGAGDRLLVIAQAFPRV